MPHILEFICFICVKQWEIIYYLIFNESECFCERTFQLIFNFLYSSNYTYNSSPRMWITIVSLLHSFHYFCDFSILISDLLYIIYRCPNKMNLSIMISQLYGSLRFTFWHFIICFPLIMCSIYGSNYLRYQFHLAICFLFLCCILSVLRTSVTFPFLS